MPGYRDLREFIASLEKAGKVYRFSDPINKERHLLPLYRVQQRGVPDEERKVLLFENVVGARGNQYHLSVLAGIYGASDEILWRGLGCSSYQEALERWHEGRTHPIDPVLLEDGPVHENVLVGDDIQRVGLDVFPVPVEEPGFSAMLRTGLPMITRDPETGIRNVGVYNGFFKARDRLQTAISPGGQAMAYHWKTARGRREGLPLAIVIGCNPEVMVAGSSGVPYGFDELAMAGGMVGSPVELVRCRTIPLEVPAYAEAVIEGIMSTTIVEPRLPFGEYPGHIHVDMNVRPVLKVTAITYRNNAMFTPVTVGFWPSDTSAVFGFCHAAPMYHRLKYEQGFPVDEVYYPHSSGGSEVGLIRIQDGVSQDTVHNMIQELARRGARYTILVDTDINLQDADLVLWALSYRASRTDDITVVSTGRPPAGLDPSSAPPGEHGQDRMGTAGIGGEAARVIINATRKWAYPPVALPAKDYMEEALAIWAQHQDLPKLQLRQPWHGYTLGYWPDELQRYADMIVRGDYLKLGEEMEELQQPVRDTMADLTPRVR